MILKYIFVLIFFISITSDGLSQGWKNYPYIPDGSLISFPADEGHHPEESIEWWYTAGHLKGNNSGTRYSYMLTYFYFPAYGFDGFRILNLNNDDTGQFYTETTAVNFSVLTEDSLNINAVTLGGINESWINKTDTEDNIIPFEYTLSAEAEHGLLDLEYVSEKPPLILGDGGYFNQGKNSYTYYFSLTKSIVNGTLTFNDITEDVSGTAWIDRQYGSFNPLTEEDYEWFFIQLSNEIDLNIYNLFTDDRQLPDTSTYRHMSVYVDSTSQYTTHNFNVERLSFHYMPDSIMCYSQKWRVTSAQNNIDLIITTLHNNSEVQLPFRFFEGSTSITGTVNGIPVTGIGYAELLHSYEKPELNITYPLGDSWTSTRAISWEVVNPDDGRPLRYNVECSTDDKESFITIAQGLTDPHVFWDNPPITAGSSCWFRVTAYSIDSTLINTVISSSSSEYDPNLTAIDENVNQYNLFEIYPNPAEDLLFLDLKADNTFTYYQVMDVYGRVLTERKITIEHRIQIDLTKYLSGIYIIGLSSKEGLVVSKFIVQ